MHIPGMMISGPAFAALFLFNATILIIAIASIVKILHRMGFSGWWVLLMGLWPILLPLLALSRWPAVDGFVTSDR